MTCSDIEAFARSLGGVVSEDAMGYRFFFVGDQRLVPFVSIAQADNDYDRVSRLDREGVFRVNIGASKATFDRLFPGFNKARAFDYAALDVFMPHPDYAGQFFVCILNPSERNAALTKELIAEAHALASKRQAARKGE